MKLVEPFAFTDVSGFLYIRVLIQHLFKNICGNCWQKTRYWIIVGCGFRWENSHWDGGFHCMLGARKEEKKPFSYIVSSVWTHQHNSHVYSGSNKYFPCLWMFRLWFIDWFWYSCSVSEIILFQEIFASMLFKEYNNSILAMGVQVW